MSRIENHKFTIDEAFRECFYIVPDYQREYVWTDREVNQLLTDIHEQLDGGSDNEYFIGTILVAPSQQKNHYEVIDGQQRLTTFFLILCALKSLFEGHEQSSLISNLISTSYTDKLGEVRKSLKLEPRYEYAGDVISKIVELNTDAEKVRNEIISSGIPKFGSLNNLLAAYSTIHAFLKETYSTENDLKKYWGYLSNSVVFIQISTDVSSALKIFETINERGVGLNPMDLLKNLLFTHVNQTEFNKLKDEWKKITKPLELSKEKPLRFLRYFVMANFVVKNSRGDSVVREDEIYDWFVNKENAETCGYQKSPFEFVRKLIQNVDKYINFSKGLGNDGNINLAMDNLKRLTGGAFSLHFVLLLAASNLPKELFDIFVKNLEDFLFYYIFTKTPTKELERNFSVWADDIRTISKIDDRISQEKEINVFISERFKKNMIDKSRELSDALNRLKLGGMQQYRIRYLLAKISQYVDHEYTGSKINVGLDQYFRLEIEHILPNNPNAELLSQWKEINPNSDYSDYKTRLGNLTLLEKPINIVAGRNFFVDKCAEYEKSQTYFTRSISRLTNVGTDTSITRLNNDLKSFNKWGSHEIEERQLLITKLCARIWKSTDAD